jgi:hypothetical protein
MPFFRIAKEQLDGWVARVPQSGRMCSPGIGTHGLRLSLPRRPILSDTRHSACTND